MTQTTVLGYSTSELIALMLDNGVHTSVDAFKRLAIQLQQRALTHEKQEAALGLMHENEVELGLDDETMCGCETCQPHTGLRTRMILCATCGNKRCPHATDHRLACTNSNEPGQPGSSYGVPLTTEDDQYWDTSK